MTRGQTIAKGVGEMIETGDYSDDNDYFSQARNQWYGVDFCPHPDAPCIDGCSFCGVSLEINEHNHTLQQRNPDRYECVCFNC